MAVVSTTRSGGKSLIVRCQGHRRWLPTRTTVARVCGKIAQRIAFLLPRGSLQPPTLALEPHAAPAPATVPGSASEGPMKQMADVAFCIQQLALCCTLHVHVRCLFFFF